ncbi:hypothetical protein ONZ45_g9908 [Pleurotus djamor]|nr:hypothetical protein ONZ45_g9908 [Pleurotus djamor]
MVMDRCLPSIRDVLPEYFSNLATENITLSDEPPSPQLGPDTQSHKTSASEEPRRTDLTYNIFKADPGSSSLEQLVTMKASADASGEHVWISVDKPSTSHTPQPNMRHQQHICTVCQKAFSRAGSLQTHMNMHSNLKPHICGICGRKFSVRSNMLRHLRGHSKNLDKLQAA